ncbi:hypothetical protein RJ639_019024 [Escallonia herrerae]|uniref:RPW8 domain-containing protein n=1 Tax=Escallonia herrerae TaxID=1293975 RepID=A0AA89AIZ1_9ASTE|nr:hypothetical protein RJ639_019024 [Escallonia herrerae]
MAAGLVKAGVVGSLIAEIQKFVLDVAIKNIYFKSDLDSLVATLNSIEPNLLAIEKYNKELNRAEQTQPYIDLLNKGKKLVQRCSTIGSWNVGYRYRYSNKLINYNADLLSFCRVKVQLDQSSEIKEMLVKVNQAEDEGGYARGGSFLGGFGEDRELMDKVFGLELPLEELKDVVLLKDSSVVLLSAPGGCGKTTLAKMLCRDPKIQDIYKKNIFFVTVSKIASITIIVQKLFQSKGYQRQFEKEDEALMRFKGFLEQQKGTGPILLVLDDVWPEGEPIIRKFKFNIEGFKILVTSRSILPSINRFTYRLNPLKEQYAMSLFHHSAFPADSMSSYVPDPEIVNKIVDNCNGFPLALIVVGQSLSGRPEVTWRITLDKWSKGKSILDSSSDLLNKLQTSVDALDEIKEKPDLKNCYLDLGSFPEDERIPAIALHDMWVELYNLDEEDMYTYEYLEELAMRNLVTLMSTSIGASNLYDFCNGQYVTQHDLLRELAVYLSNREPVELRKRVILEITGNKFPKWWAEKLQEPINARLLSISTDEAFSLCLDSIQLPKVEVLILNSRTKNYSLPLFAEKPGQLKVLIIANYGGCPAELNNFSEVDYLSNLKRIRLEHVSISSLGTSLVKLPKLQKMSLIMCEIGKIFDDCNNMFPDLVEIEIACCADLVEFPVGLCKIGHLKKLSITECNELIALPEALGALTSLEVLRLHSCTKLEGLPESIGNLHKLKSLDISDCVSMSRMPVRMNELCDLRTLYMSGCWGLSELPQSVEDLDQQLKVICDDQTANLWRFLEYPPAKLELLLVQEAKNLYWLRRSM